MCGGLKYICRNEDPDVQFRVTETTCLADRAVQIEESSLRDGNNDYKPSPGSKLVAEPFLDSGGDPASVRESHYRREYEKREQLALDAAAV